MSGAENAQAWAGHLHVCPECSDWYMTYILGRRGIRPDFFPCVHMGYYVTMECPEHPYPEDCPDRVILYSPTFDEYGIRIGVGHAEAPEGSEYAPGAGGGAYTIKHCPWCGVTLPKSKLHQWLQELHELGFEEPFTQEIPDKYRSDEWWRMAEEA